MERAISFSVFHLCLGYRRSEVHVPHCGGLDLVDVSFFVQVQETELGYCTGPIVDSRVFLIPINRKAKHLPQFFEGHLIFRSNNVTKFNKVTT